MGRVLAIDYGKRRIGLAISDSEKSVALPLKTIDTARTHVIEEIKRVVENFQIKEIVIGVPVRLPAGLKESRTLEEIRKFEQELKDNLKGVKIYEIDETLTSKEASALLKETGRIPGKEKVDTIAAMLILEEYLKRTKEQ